MKVSAISIDDEPLARQRIRLLLDDEPDVELVAECSSGEEAVEMIKFHSPDLLFLDIQMPGMDGFELLAKLSPDALPTVIFTTAYDQHAIRAFDAHALDYLLKPFKPERFRRTIQRARQHLDNKKSGDTGRRLLDLLDERRSTSRVSLAPPPTYLARLAVKAEDKVFILKTSDIEYIESAGNYVVATTGKESHVLRETLTALEKQLDPANFIRLSRSAIVNVDCISELTPTFKGGHTVVMRNGKQLATTRGMRDLEEAMKYR